MILYVCMYTACIYCTCHTMLYSTSHSIEAVSRVSGMDDQNLSKRLQVNLLVKPEDCSHITSHVTST